MIDAHKAAKAVSGGKGHYRYYDGKEVDIGSFFYSKEDSGLPLSKFFCGWKQAEVCEIEINDLSKPGFWIYDIEFSPKLLPLEFTGRRITSNLAVILWNYALKNFEAVPHEMTKIELPPLK